MNAEVRRIRNARKILSMTVEQMMQKLLAGRSDTLPSRSEEQLMKIQLDRARRFRQLAQAFRLAKALKRKYRADTLGDVPVDEQLRVADMISKALRRIPQYPRS